MKNKTLKYALLIIIAFIIINNFIFVPENILSWDVFGYYLYLPLKFIYNDLGLNHISVIHDIINKYNNTISFYQANEMPGGTYVMKYTMGLSFFYAPFFFIAHLIAALFSYPQDGFSLPYQYSIFIGGILYSILGIWVLSKVLMRLFPEKIVAIVLMIIVFGTNYIVHITMYGQNAMSQNYLFLMYALIIWYTLLWHESYQLKHAILLAIVCGLTILSRPSEIVCLIIPLLWGLKNFTSTGKKLKTLLSHKWHIMIFAMIIILFGSFQFIYWRIYAGKFLYYSYGANAGEGFEFSTPYFLDVLWSFRKGWLLYTPVMLFAIIGLFFVYKYKPTIFYALTAYFLVNLYIVSSWSCWWYAQSFSQRALIPSYPVMAIGLGYFLFWLNQQRVVKKIIYSILVGLILLNLFQTIQFHYGVINSDRMTGPYYWRVFGKIDVSDEDRKLLLVKRSFSSEENFDNKEAYTSRLLKKMSFEDSIDKDSIQSFSGKYSFRLDSTVIYSPNFESAYSELTNKDHAWISASAYVYPTKDVVSNPFSLVVHFVHNGYSYKYGHYDSENMKLELNKWNKIDFNYLTPEVRRKNDFVKIYFWNRGKAPVFIDDFEISAFEKK